MITSIDMAWFAGFMEGEGHFRVSHRGVSPRVTASQVQKEPLQKIHDLFGGLLFLRKHQKEKWNDCWIWEVSGLRAAELCLSIYGLMSEKRRKQIDGALTGWKQSNPRRATGSFRCSKGHMIEGENVLNSKVRGKPGYVVCKICNDERNYDRHRIELIGRKQIIKLKSATAAKDSIYCCVVCGAPFIATSSRSKYCSSQCNIKSYTIMRAFEYIVGMNV